MRDTILVSTKAMNDPGIVVWVQHDEIRYMGKMFDIKHTTHKNNCVQLIGHYDKFENKLFKLLNKLLDPGKNDKQKKQHTGMWLTDAIICCIDIPFLQYYYQPQGKKITYSSPHYQSYKADSESKPPEA